MNTNLLIYNGFGIVPTSSYTAAGLDFYIPFITDSEHVSIALKAFEKSYKKTEDEINEIWAELHTAAYNEFKEEIDDVIFVNVLHLFLALDSPMLNDNMDSIYEDFIGEHLIKEDGVWGLWMYEGDTVLFNSGIKVALDTDTAGIFFNKSGRGNQGWDTRACVVDEDYAGYVHLSAAYTKDSWTQNKIFCGDKLMQMVVLPIIHKTPETISEDEYNELLKNSKRGDGALGSTNEIKITI